MRLGGLQDVANDHDVSRVSVWRWTQYESFPAPAMTTARGALYDLDAVAAWKATRSHGVHAR